MAGSVASTYLRTNASKRTPGRDCRARHPSRRTAASRSLCLGAEDNERAQREDAEEREERGRDWRPPSRGAGTHRQRREESEDHEEPKHDPYAEHLADGSGDREEDQEDRDQDRLEDREIAVRRFEAA